MSTKERFKGALWANTIHSILLGGAGGISSWTALFLSRSNEHTIHIVDYDRVEDVNLAGQFYSVHSVGDYKTNALSKTVNSVVNGRHNLVLYNDRIENSLEYLKSVCDIFIAGFDNMEARRVMYEAWKEKSTRKIFIEARLLAEYFEVYFVLPGREEEYEKTLFEDSEETERIACTFKATSHFGAMCGSIITHGLNSYIANANNKNYLYSIPFKYTFSGPSWSVEIEDFKGKDFKFDEVVQTEEEIDLMFTRIVEDDIDVEFEEEIINIDTNDSN
jgi:molybdopterin/thiamine biosynthesis adenylyltransferase